MGAEARLLHELVAWEADHRPGGLGGHLHTGRSLVSASGSGEFMLYPLFPTNMASVESIWKISFLFKTPLSGAVFVAGRMHFSLSQGLTVVICLHRKAGSPTWQTIKIARSPNAAIEFEQFTRAPSCAAARYSRSMSPGFPPNKKHVLFQGPK